MKIVKLNILTIASFILLVGCSGEVSSDSNSKGETIKIGSLHPLSGGQALEGQEMRDGVRLAIKEKNEDGGIKSLGGMHVELIESDHEGIPEKGISEVQKLDWEGVVGIVG